MSNLANMMWLLVSTFVFVAYIVVMFQIVVDLFRDHELSGWLKALWIIGLLFVPILTALLYVIIRGRGMAQRQRAAAERARQETAAYVRDVAGTSSVDQIAKAKALLDAGTIDTNEFARLKQQALAGAHA